MFFFPLTFVCSFSPSSRFLRLIPHFLLLTLLSLTSYFLLRSSHFLLLTSYVCLRSSHLTSYLFTSYVLLFCITPNVALLSVLLVRMAYCIAFLRSCFLLLTSCFFFALIISYHLSVLPCFLLLISTSIPFRTSVFRLLLSLN